MDLISSHARTRWISLAVLATVALTACGGGDDGEVATGQPPVPPSSSGGASNHAPTISGMPAAATLYGQPYSFTPAASDADGDALTFSISGRPSWATFNTANGSLQGTPTPADVGTSANVVISVSDGTATTSLAPFSVQVVPTATGTATLSWSPPTQNEDGSALTDLASYRVYFGTSAGSYPNSLTVANAGIATFVVDQLTPATWYFVVTAVNEDGVESTYSNVAAMTVL